MTVGTPKIQKYTEAQCSMIHLFTARPRYRSHSQRFAEDTVHNAAPSMNLVTCTTQQSPLISCPRYARPLHHQHY